MDLTYRRKGRTVSPRQFLDGLKGDIMDAALTAIADEMHGKAAAIVDPETGKHAPVMVRRISDERLSIHADGSPAFARMLEGRLGLRDGEVRRTTEPAAGTRLVYLAHATDDKAVAEPIATGLRARGIEVWYDDWEIDVGDSLRQRMEQGLGDCTHFLVLLTPRSITRPWVAEEIDAGLMRAVEGSAKFLGVRDRLEVGELSPFLRTRKTPSLGEGESGIDELADAILGVRAKPPLGDEPQHVKAFDPSTGWSIPAQAIAKWFCENTEHGSFLDPQTTLADLVGHTGMPLNSVKVGVIDLVGSGLLDRTDYYGGHVDLSPKFDLFVTFDAQFTDHDPRQDAQDLAVALLNLEADQADATAVGEKLGWPPRRFNPAAAYLVSARIVKPIEYSAEDSYWPPAFLLGDELLRFVSDL